MLASAYKQSDLYAEKSLFLHINVVNNMQKTTTVEAVLGAMVRNKRIRIVGSGRNTKYLRY